MARPSLEKGLLHPSKGILPFSSLNLSPPTIPRLNHPVFPPGEWASTDLGIPLRLNSDFNVPSVRSSVKETYDQIISDLKMSLNFLPNTASFKTRPSKAAAYGLLARTYLSMGDYDSAFKYADSCLSYIVH